MNLCKILSWTVFGIVGLMGFVLIMVFAPWPWDYYSAFDGTLVLGSGVKLLSSTDPFYMDQVKVTPHHGDKAIGNFTFTLASYTSSNGLDLIAQNQTVVYSATIPASNGKTNKINVAKSEGIRITPIPLNNGTNFQLGFQASQQLIVKFYDSRQFQSWIVRHQSRTLRYVYLKEPVDAEETMSKAQNVQWKLKGSRGIQSFSVPKDDWYFLVWKSTATTAVTVQVSFTGSFLSFVNSTAKPKNSQTGQGVLSIPAQSKSDLYLLFVDSTVPTTAPTFVNVEFPGDFGRYFGIFLAGVFFGGYCLVGGVVLFLLVRRFSTDSSSSYTSLD